MNTTIDTNATVLLAFWHRTRRETVPMTAEEVVDKTGLTMTETRYALTAMRQAGWLTAKKLSGELSIRTYEPTPRGAELIARAIQQRATREDAA